VSKEKIGVIGAGLMGHGIAYRFAAAGHEVGIFEPVAELRETLATRLRAIVDLLAGDPACVGRVSVHDQLASAVGDAALVIEAAPEKLALKQKLFADLEAVVAPGTILASNSSAIPSTEIGRHLKHRERVVGTHFWNPPHLVPLVEVIQTDLVPRDESEELRAYRMEWSRAFLGPGGLATPDDVEALESCQAGLAARELEWSDISRGMHRQPRANDELQIRGFWREWQHQLGGRPAGSEVGDKSHSPAAAGEGRVRVP